MENNAFTASLPGTDHNHLLLNAVSSHFFSSPLMDSGTIDHSSYSQIMTSSLLPTAQEEGSLNNIYMQTNNGAMFSDEVPISRTMLQFGDYSNGYNNGANMRRAADNSVTLALPMDVRSFVLTDSNHSLESSNLTPRTLGYGTQDVASYLSLGAISTVHPSYRVGESSLPRWEANSSTLEMDHSDCYRLPRYELSLSLGSCQPCINNMPDIPSHCSDKSCSGETVVRPQDSEELSLRRASSPCSMLGSRYLHVAQQILVEFTNCALGTYDELDYSLYQSIGVSSAGGFSEFTPSRESDLHEGMGHSLETEESKRENSKVLAMLQMIDNKYNQFLDQIQNVVATFHDIASLATRKMHARFALHTVTAMYKNSREQITRYLSSQECCGKYTREEQADFESSFIRRQWALQQLGRKDQQSWRPQRGLPERSVSVLKAWMFQNFLHPYPKDRDKHFLAIQSGLTRNQVSNWFINARVRLWKPMIEEMYSEIKKQQTEQGIQGEFRGHRNEYQQLANVNELQQGVHCLS